MGEYLSAQITIGGTLPATQIDPFLEILEDERTLYKGGVVEREELERLVFEEQSLELFCEEASYGELEALETFCREYGLTYRRTCEARYEFNAEIAYWEPGMKSARVEQANQDGQLMLPFDELDDLLQHHPAEYTLREVLDLYRVVLKEIPPLLLTLEEEEVSLEGTREEEPSYDA